MVDKPGDVFDRDREWSALSTFVESDRAGAMLGLVYGRRRQGKTFLLQELTQAYRGFYFDALQQSSTQNLQRLSGAYQAFTGARAPVQFATWEQGLGALLALGERATEPAVVVIDEFPYLLDTAPELASVLQSLLRPRGAAVRGWKTRVILCGSALSTMQGLLAHTAPLRGRAALDLLVHPFGYRDAAAYWGVDSDPDLAMRLNALIGGTPAYRDMCPASKPPSGRTFDSWVVDNLLNPASAMFREGDILLAEQAHLQDQTPYLSVLSAISQGRTRSSEIAALVGKSASATTQLLNVLVDTQFVSKKDDVLRQKRSTYHLDEPVQRLQQLVIAPNEPALVRHQGKAVWAASAETVQAQIYGPHFERLCRSWCEVYASPVTLGGTPRRAGTTVVPCGEHSRTHEIDVVVQDGSGTVQAIGEAKWATKPVDVDQLHRLEHVRALLPASRPRLMLFSRRGFSSGLQHEASTRADVELVSVERLYVGS